MIELNQPIEPLGITRLHIFTINLWDVYISTKEVGYCNSAVNYDTFSHDRPSVWWWIIYIYTYIYIQFTTIYIYTIYAYIYICHATSVTVENSSCFVVVRYRSIHILHGYLNGNEAWNHTIAPACKQNTTNHNKFMCAFHRANIYIIQDVPRYIVYMEFYDLQPEVHLIQWIGLTLSLGIKQTNTTVRLKSQDTIYFHAIHAISVAQCKPHPRLQICTVLNYRFTNTTIDL